MPENLKGEAYVDAPLPIGERQTISQPLTVAFMLELLQPEAGDNILDVGFGSGWTTALLAEIVGEKGKVFAIERVAELCEFGKKNVVKYNFGKDSRVEMICGDGTKGWPDKNIIFDNCGAITASGSEWFDNCGAITASGSERFDKILAGASGKEMPRAWKEQLKIGGRIVAPVENSIWLVIKTKVYDSLADISGNASYSRGVKKDENEFEEIEYPGFVFVPLIGD